MEQQAWPGFSPGPVSVTMSPERFEFNNPLAGASADDQPDSPLVFMRTPGVHMSDNACPDSSKRFNNWMESTSPYTARKTPPTASMKSMAAGDENTPPAHERGLSEKGSSFGSQQHFQSWLQATNSTSWTPRKSPAAATPPPPAPSPAGTPMSIMRDLQHSAATPCSTQQQHRQAAAGQHARPAAAQARGDGGFGTSDSEDEDAGEASTTIGAAQLAAAADRAAAASRMAGLRAQAGSSGGNLGAACVQQQQQHRQLSTPPRVPASSPAVRSPTALGWQQQQRQTSVLQAAADRMAQDCLATPMSQLSLSRSARPGQQGEGGAGAVTPGALVDRGLSRETASGLPASPAEKLIGLMMSPGGGGHRRHHHHAHNQQQGQQATTSRLSAALGAAGPQAQAPLSPNLQVIDLMMHPDAEAAEGQAGPGGSSDSAAVAEVAAAEGGAGSDSADSDSGSVCSSESGDEMDLAELQALCGEGVGPDTPLSVILGMLTGTPQVTGLTPSLVEAERQQQQGGNDDIGPRVLFADD